MKILKNVISYILVITMLVSVLPVAIAAQDEEYRISNGYMQFAFNGKTGGFAIETAEGNPQKVLDNNIPLLYAEDKEKSNGTSFITVRIGEKDYIFGQDYSFFGINSSLGTVEIKEEGRLMEIPWTIGDITVVLSAALDNNTESNTTGNVGLSFNIINNGKSDENVSVRLLLDTALGSEIDAPYFVVDKEQFATLTEKEFNGSDVPQQIRSVDSLSNPTKLSYILTQGWNDGTKPDRVVLGHWANLADTRYDYIPDPYCDFSNYSNTYREPDSAAAIYWQNNELKPGESFKGELLYGVGNFSDATDMPMGINITTERVELNSDKKSYKNDGKIKVTVEIDNTVDNSVELSNAMINLVVDEKKFVVLDGTPQTQFTTLGKEIKTLQYTLQAVPQEDLCAGTVYVSVTGDKVLSDGNLKSFETAAERSIVLPSVGEISEVQLNKINPEKVYTDGEKSITVSGRMKPLEALLADDAKVNLKLVHETSDHYVIIEKNQIAFLDEKCETMTFSTSKTLSVGEYSIVFEINDSQLCDQLKCNKITSNQKLEVSADERYKIKSYGMMALVRSTDSEGTDYDFYTFTNENAYSKFYNGEASAKGELHGKELKYDFGKDEKAIGQHEILITVRGRLHEMKDAETSQIFWQAETSEGDITINNMLSYEGDSPLKIYNSGSSYTVEGDGLLKVVDSINVWRKKWSISAEKGDIYTLDEERIKEALGEDTEVEELTLSFDGAASMIQSLGGFAVDLKYGVLSSQWYDNSDGAVTYGIGFGGSISLPIKAKKDKSNDDTSGGDESGTTGGTTGGQTGGTTGGGESSASSGGTTGNSPNTNTALPDLTADQEDISDSLAMLFDDSTLSNDVENISGDLSEMFDDSSFYQSGSGSGSESGSGSSSGTGTGSTPAPSTQNTTASNPPKTSSTGDKIKRDNDLPEGQLSAEVDNVLFGEKAEVKDGYVKVDETGFIGIDATFSLELPEDVLGSFVSNAPGISASVMINTIKNQYEINAGLSIKIIECEGVLAFKQVQVKSKDVILPDKIEFYIRDGLRLPIAPPTLYMTGLGGGVNNLADTIGGQFDSLPPITILLFTRLEAIAVLEGEFNAQISLEGMSLTGEMGLNVKGLEDAVEIDAGISARWIEPWELSLYGNISIIDGLIRGGITVTIADDYFYGYVFASIYIPDSIPLVGGKELAGVEAAVSNEFIGANVKIIGIKFGVIYYWGDKVSFGSNIDLSPPERNTFSVNSIAIDESSENAIGYYGTNIHMLSSTALNVGETSKTNNYKETVIKVDNAEGQDALLIEIPYTGTTPEAGQIKLYPPKSSEAIELIPDDGKGGGNMLVQSRDGKNYIYITVTDSDKIKNGEWTIKYEEDSAFEIEAFSMSGVDNIPELNENGTKIKLGATDPETNCPTVITEWKIDGSEEKKTGVLDVYLTEDKDILSKIETSDNKGDVLGTNVLHKENYALVGGTDSEIITLPDAMPSGTYYAVTTLSSTDGISLAISSEPVNFVNPNLPEKVQDVHIAYGGNGEIFVKVTDADKVDYTHYIAEIVAEDGTILQNAIGQFEQGANFVFGKEALLEEGKSYHVNVKTLREEYKKSDNEYKTHYYYGTDIVSSNTIEMPKVNLPKLKNVKVNFDTSADDVYTNKSNVIIEYEFENDVFVELDLNGGKVYAFGVNPDPKERSTFFRKNWKFVLDDLEDGDYVVDFTAYTDKKDNITGSAVSDVENSYFAFTVDTSAPILSLAQSAVMRSDKVNVVFGSNTVVADENGSYTIEGLTEKSVILKLDGEEINENTNGTVFASNGSFSITKSLSADEMYKSHTITATDKAGNVSEMIVYAVRNGALSFEKIEFYKDGVKVSPDKNGVKTVKLKNSQQTELSVYAITSGGEEFKLDNDLVEWSVLYEKNAIALNDGKVTALSPRETAVKAKLVTADVSGDTGKRSEGLSDYIVFDIINNSKSDLIEKIEEATIVLTTDTEASQSKRDEFQNAIAEAQEVANNPSASESDYTDAVTMLERAITEFKKPEKTGNNHSGGSGAVRKYTIKTEDCEHGKVEASQKQVYSGGSVTITAVPDDGYVVAEMIINGESVGRNEKYTISSVKEDISVKVLFAEKTDLPFKDVISTDWFYEYVKSAYEKGLMKGVSSDMFEPKSELTRAMFVTILHRIDGEKLEGENVFSDVSDEDYYCSAVAWASANGIVKGVSETQFAPDENITREQIAAIFYRYAQAKGYDVSVGENTNILSYVDYDEISEYAIPAMSYAVGSGLINGKTESTLNPRDNATRAEAAAIIQRFIEGNK